LHAVENNSSLAALVEARADADRQVIALCKLLDAGHRSTEG
jgi:hypothetical protein